MRGIFFATDLNILATVYLSRLAHVRIVAKLARVRMSSLTLKCALIRVPSSKRNISAPTILFLLFSL